MNDDEIIAILRAKSEELTAVELADVLDSLTNGGLTQGVIVTYFKRAFPSIPLRTLIDASGWSRVSDGTLSDEQFDLLLTPWIKSNVRS